MVRSKFSREKLSGWQALEEVPEISPNEPTETENISKDIVIEGQTAVLADHSITPPRNDSFTSFKSTHSTFSNTPQSDLTCVEIPINEISRDELTNTTVVTMKSPNNDKNTKNDSSLGRLKTWYTSKEGKWTPKEIIKSTKELPGALIEAMKSHEDRDKSVSGPEILEADINNFIEITGSTREIAIKYLTSSSSLAEAITLYTTNSKKNPSRAALQFVGTSSMCYMPKPGPNVIKPTLSLKIDGDLDNSSPTCSWNTSTDNQDQKSLPTDNQYPGTSIADIVELGGLDITILNANSRRNTEDNLEENKALAALRLKTSNTGVNDDLDLRNIPVPKGF